MIKSGSGGGQRTPLSVNTAKEQKGIEATDIEETVFKKNKSDIEKRAQVALEVTAIKVGVRRLL